MIPYIELSDAAHTVFASFAMLLTLGAVLLMTGIGMLHTGRKYLICSIILTAAMLFVFQGMTDICNSSFGGIKNITVFGRAAGSAPYAASAAFFVSAAAAEIFLFSALVHRRKNQLTEGAVKESLDSLPDGVCFYSADGQPLLANRQIQHICGDLFNSEILNVRRFQSRLISEAAAGSEKIIRTVPTVIAQTSDGKVWDFHCRELNTEKAGLYELIAFDITEQYSLSTELKQRNERLSRVNERLRRFDSETAALTVEKELLNAKIQVHDNIGRSLLACRAYFMQKPEERSREELLLLWRQVISVMKNKALPSDERDMLRKSANMLGIAVELTGTLPEDPKIRPAVVTAIRECITNTANHAGGDKLFVNISENNNALTAELTNTGAPPESEISETGGLKNLRRITEGAGGIMTIESTPRFLLRLEFQKGENSE